MSPHTVSESTAIPGRKHLLGSAFLTGLWAGLSRRLAVFAKFTYRKTDRLLEATGHKLGDLFVKVMSKHPRTRKSVYRYGVTEVKRESVLGVKTAFISVLLMVLLPLAQFAPVLAATDNQTLVPNGDNANGANDWAQNSGTNDGSCTGGTDCDFVDEDGETDWLGTGTAMDADAEQEFDMTDLSPPGSFNHVSDVTVTINAHANGGCQSDCDTLEVRLFINGAYDGTTNSATMTATATDHTFNWTGLTEPAHSDIRVEVFRRVQGGGNPGGRDDDVRMYDVRAEVTYDYTITTNVEQTHFRWRDDSTALDTDGGWLAAEDSNVIGDINQLQTYRLRVEAANVSATVAANAFEYRLEYAVKDGTCGASAGWARITTASDAFEMVDTTHFANGESLDNSRLTASETTFVAGEGLDTADQSSAISLGVDEYTELEYSVRATADATEGETYCFRLTDAGATLNAYPAFPEVTIHTPPPVPYLTQEGYVFENDDGGPDSTGPLSADSATNGGCTQVDWTNLFNITDDDGNEVTANVESTIQSNCLNINFTDTGLGSGVQILGVEVEIEKSGTETLEEETVRLTESGFPLGDNKQISGWSGTSVYGGPDDLWGLSSISTEDIDNYGVVIDVSCSCQQASTAGIDYATITVYYKNQDSTVAGSEFSTGKTLSQVRQGESINLRTHLTNTGGILDSTDELALFYDRNDGIWTKVQHRQPAETAAGNCTDTDWDCLVVYSDTSTAAGEDTSMAIAPDGRPWIAFEEETTQGLRVAQYVGSGGTGCGDSATGAWSCEIVFDDADVQDGSRNSIGFDPSGKAWVSFFDRLDGDTVVAEYVGSGGSGCGTAASAAWSCTIILDTTRDLGGGHTSLAFDAEGDPWVSMSNSDNQTIVAEYVGSGGSNCGAGASAAWDCTVALDGPSTPTGSGISTSIAFDLNGNPWVSMHKRPAFNDGQTIVAEYVGSGGSNCGAGASAAWDCTVAFDGSADSTLDGQFTSIAFAPDGTALVSLHDRGNGDAIVAEYVGSGGSNCGTAASVAWDCTVIFDGTTDTIDGSNTSAAFDASGNPWVSFYDSTNDTLVISQYVGMGGSGCGTGASSAWTCKTITSVGSSETASGLVFDTSGKAWVSYEDVTNNQIEVAQIKRAGEILIAPSVDSEGGDNLSESHADMTSSTDTTGRDDADCLAGSTTWNNGLYFGAENGSGLALPAGDRTAQCTEIVWTLDTSQATPGETYRFVVATKDSFRPNKGPWRGPISVTTDGYPTITIASDDQSTYRYSKDNTPKFSNCTDTDWGCDEVDAGATQSGVDTTIAFSPSGIPWITYGHSDRLEFAVYVGSGGTGCNTDGEWDCASVYNGSAGRFASNSLAFDPSGNPWVSFTRCSNSLCDSDIDLWIAQYVGSGGTGCNTARTNWTCVELDGSETFIGEFTSLAFDPSGNPWVSYYNQTSGALMVARYVGSGGNCTSTAWDCEEVDSSGTDTGLFTSLAFDPSGNPWVSYYNQASGSLMVANYVGSDGICSSTAWDCIAVDTTVTDVGGQSSLAFDSSGNPWVSYRDATNTALRVATLGGGFGAACTGGSWTCGTVDDTATSTGWGSSITFDAEGNPWVSYIDHTNDPKDLKVAHYVASGGDCTSGAWDCTTIRGGLLGGLSNFRDFTTIAFDHSGIPWVSYALDNTFTFTPGIAKLHLPPSALSYETNLPYNGRNAGSGTLRYMLTSGLAPYTDPYGTCGGTADLYGYCGLFHPDGQMDSITAGPNERPIYGFSQRYDNNNTVPSAKVNFRTTASPATQNVVLQVYRYGSTDAWETVDTYSTAGCDTSNCVIHLEPTGTTSEYFEADGSNYWLHFRLYQEESASSDTTLYIDGFGAPQTSQQLRHGRIFRDLNADPLRW